MPKRLTLFAKKRHDEAIILLDQVFQQNPDRRGLSQAMTLIYNKVVEAQITNKDYARARQILDTAKEKYGDRLDAVRDNWSSKLSAIAESELTKARNALAAGELKSAFEAVRRGASIWPDADGVADLTNEITSRYPLARVAVDQLSLESSSRQIDNWAAYRTSKLTSRNFVEFVGVSSEGGEFRSDFVAVETADDRKQVTLDLSSLSQANGPDGYDLAKQLLRATNEESLAYEPDLGESIDQVSVLDVFKVQLQLRKPHLLAASLLERTIQPTERVQLFRQPKIEGAEARYYANGNAPTPAKFREIVEIKFDVGSQAVVALEQNDVDVVDRVFPAYVARLVANPELAVGTYRIPTLHMLALNFERPILANRTFRRAITYAINRQQILQQEILAGKKLSGCTVISGPIPIGRSEDDALGYAYDNSIVPRIYDPRVALTLKEIALREISLTDNTALKLVHPPSETARIACQRISKSLAAIGVECEVKELEKNASADEWDVRYTEVALREPLVDVHRLFGAGGLIQHNSSHVRLALRSLSDGETWEVARQRLRLIHNLTHDELVVIPLWQITEHFAYRNIDGIGRDPVSLYQNVNRWIPRPQ